MPTYLSVEEIMAIHELLIKDYGGTPGVRDRGALESAVMRPQSGYYSNLSEEAAALWESLVINHPFIDGNKRIGLAAAEVFLNLNGHEINSTSEELYQWKVLLLEGNTFILKKIIDFLSSRVCLLG